MTDIGVGKKVKIKKWAYNEWLNTKTLKKKNYMQE